MRWFRGVAALSAGAALLTFGAGAAAASVGPEDVAPSSPAPTTVPMNFDAQGWAEVRTGIRGRVTIAGSFRGTLDRATGRYTGGFALTPTRAHVTVLGILPVVAETDWAFTEPVSGEWRDGVLTMRVAARIKHPRLLAFGTIQVAGGPNCATRNPSVMELRSSPSTPIGDPLSGATLTTSGQGFTISALSGCGALDGLLSAVAAGSGNQATLQLTPPKLG